MALIPISLSLTLLILFLQVSRLYSSNCFKYLVDTIGGQTHYCGTTGLSYGGFKTDSNKQLSVTMSIEFSTDCTPTNSDSVLFTVAITLPNGGGQKNIMKVTVQKNIGTMKFLTDDSTGNDNLIWITPAVYFFQIPSSNIFL